MPWGKGGGGGGGGGMARGGGRPAATGGDCWASELDGGFELGPPLRVRIICSVSTSSLLFQPNHPART